MAYIEEGAEGYFWTDIVLDLMEGEKVVYGRYDAEKGEWKPRERVYDLADASNSVRYMKKIKRDTFINKKGHQVWDTYRIGIPEGWPYSVLWQHKVSRYVENFGECLFTVYTPIFIATRKELH